MLSKKAKTRLKQTADLLMTIPDYKFDMNTWGKSNADQDTIAIKEGFCNTTGCAFGWEASTTRARKRGLTIRPYITDNKNIRYYEIVMSDKDNPGCTLEGIDAASEYYDITREEAEFLFIPPSASNADNSEDCLPSPYKGPRPRPATVAKVLYRFIKNDGKLWTVKYRGKIVGKIEDYGYGDW